MLRSKTLKYLDQKRIAMSKGSNSKNNNRLSITLTIGVLLTVLTSLPHSAAAEAEEQLFCVQTFNAYGPAYAGDLEQRTNVVARELDALPCEMIQFQEVWTESHHKSLMAATSSSMPFLSAVRFDDFQNPVVGSSGLSTFTSQVLSHQIFHKFSINKDGLLDELREVLGVIKGVGISRMTLRDDERFSFRMFNLHLHPSSQPVRIAQLTQLIQLLDHTEPKTSPIIVTGDFNFKPNTIEYELLRHTTGLRDAYLTVNERYESDVCTYCVNNPLNWGEINGVLDYIWFKNGQSIELSVDDAMINMKGMIGLVPSDHFGLRTNFRASLKPSRENSSENDRLSRSERRATIIKAIQIIDEADHFGDLLIDTKRRLVEMLRGAH